MNGTLKTVISCVSSSVLMLIGGVLLSNYAHRGSLTSFPAYLLKEYNNWIAGNNLNEADAAAKTAAAAKKAEEAKKAADAAAKT